MGSNGNNRNGEGGGFVILNRLADRVHELGSLIMAAMLLMVLTGIFAREMLFTSLDFAEEYAAYALVAITFMGAPVAFRDKRSMFRVGLVYERLPDRVRLGIDLIWHLIALTVTLVLTWYFAKQALSVFTKGTVATTSTDTPLWIPQMLMPLGALLLSAMVLAALVETVKRLGK